MNERMMPISEAAKSLQTTPLNILMHIKKGLLNGVENDGAWYVEKNSLEILLKKTGGVKAADVCASGCAKKHACGGCGE